MIQREIFRQVPHAARARALTVFVGALATVTTIAQMALLSSIVSRAFLAHAPLAQLGSAFAGMLGLLVLRAGLVWLQEVSAQREAVRVKTRLRQRLVAHLSKLGPAYTRDERTGELVTTLVEGIERLDAYISRYLPQLPLSVITPLLVAVAVAYRDWPSALLLLATAPLLPLLMVLVGSFAQRHIQQQWTALTRMSAYLLDTLQGLPTLKIFGRGAAEGERIARVSMAFRDRTLKVLRYAFLSGLVLEFMTAGAIALIAVELGARLLAGGISFERAFFILLVAPEFYRPLRDLGLHRHAGMEGATAARRVVEILSTPTPVHEPGAGGPLPSGPVTLEFHNVTYVYPGSARPALAEVTLTLPAGARTALVGCSGAGKSTLLNLLPRFIDPTSGNITVNGLPIIDLAVENWREYLALVPQRPHLFHGSVHDNISLGRPGATRQEVEWAAELAGAATFIAQLPYGYDTPLGERAARLSGGEAQRIAIARAFLKDAPVLILDEPTSSLDPLSEELIRTALARLMHDRTVLVVAHRLNTIRTAEQIVLLDGGRVREVGTHADLLALDGLYARLVSAGSRISV